MCLIVLKCIVSASIQFKTTTYKSYAANIINSCNWQKNINPMFINNKMYVGHTLDLKSFSFSVSYIHFIFMGWQRAKSYIDSIEWSLSHSQNCQYVSVCKNLLNIFLSFAFFNSGGDADGIVRELLPNVTFTYFQTTDRNKRSSFNFLQI